MREKTMPQNPLYTPEQKAIEDKAMALLRRPEMERVKTIVTMLFRNAVAWPSRGQMDRFDNMIEEYMFFHAMRAANGRTCALTTNPMCAAICLCAIRGLTRSI